KLRHIFPLAYSVLMRAILNYGLRPTSWLYWLVLSDFKSMTRNVCELLAKGNLRLPFSLTI
ncbi:TPA: hypothetical protein ACU3BK_004926, partial [Salmonella enterica]